MSDTQKKEDPFAEFNSEEYNAGELVVDDASAKDDKPKVDAQPEKKPDPEPAADDSADEGDEGDEGGDPEPKGADGQPPRKKTVQERINDLTKARREAERRAEKLEQELAKLRQPAPPAAPKAEEKPPEEKKPDAAPKKREVDPNAPKADDYEFGEFDPAYIQDMATYAADKRFAELRQADQEKEAKREEAKKQEAAVESFNKMLDRATPKYEDFYEKVIVGSEKGAWALSESLGELALASDVGEEILYHLASDPEEAERVYRLTPVEQARYFGRMEAKFSAGQTAASGDDPGKSAPKAPKAPAPPTTARGAGGQFQAAADTDDFLAFEARANSGSK